MSSDNSPGNNELIVTRDGSHTVYSSQFDQHYHNPNGAVAESKYVFFEQTDLLGALASQSEICILEVGFGTGLNLMLLLDYCQTNQLNTDITYYSVEGFPLDPKTAASLNYSEHLDNPETGEKVRALFDKLKQGMNRFELTDNITVQLFNGLFADFPDQNIDAQYIFHDAFSPDANPDLWTGDVFKKLSQLSSGEVKLTTYCAASKAQGALAWAGWKIAKTQGALGKREMIIAALDPEQLEGLKQVNEERYARRYEEGDFD